MLDQRAHQRQPLNEVADLPALWDYVTHRNDELAPGWSLPPVMGGGCETGPSFACVFINPTHRNASTRDGWTGPRYPWIGTKAVWRVLAAAGMLPLPVADEIARRLRWDETFALKVYRAIAQEGLYLTNLVKWTGANGDLPSTRLVAAYLDILAREMAIVRPSAVIAFGGMTFKAITGADVRLGEVLESVRKDDHYPTSPFAGSDIPVFPCFFPVGRGNPTGAIELLMALRSGARR